MQHTENETSPKSGIFKQLRLPKDMKFYLKYGFNLHYLLTYVAETKVILREMYSILREKSLAMYFGDSQFRRNRTFHFIRSKIYVDKRVVVS